MYRPPYKESLYGDPGRSGGIVTARYLIGDVLEVLPTLEENSVDLILTSPPFLALRSYLPADHPDKAKEGGSQSTPGAFIDWLVDVVEALDRVLAPHGSMVIELGDTYAGSGGPSGDSLGNGLLSGSREGAMPAGVFHSGPGWPAIKSLTLIPELFRLTLVYGFNPLTGRQTKRWRLRNVVRWVRPNPPVGALGDKFRPATSELMVFCRTDEAGRRRFFDLDSVREPYTAGTLKQYKANPDDPVNDQRPTAGQGPKEKVVGWQQEQRLTHTGAPPLDWWNIPLLDGEEETPYGPKEPKGNPNYRKLSEKGKAYEQARVDVGLSSGNNIESGVFYNNPIGSPPLDWWNIPPGGYSGAHYAVFPEALCVRPIKAMCPERVCRTCGEPSRRIVESELVPVGTGNRGSKAVALGNTTTFRTTARSVIAFEWSDCTHDNYRPGLVLDPFAGSGTTLAVAVGHGRDAIGIDLDDRNARLAEERIGFFLEVVQ